jgi:hypothetical protein
LRKDRRNNRVLPTELRTAGDVERRAAAPAPSIANSLRRIGMPARKGAGNKKRYIKYHNDGTIWAKGSVLGGQPDGYFEWFRKDGTRMRSGYFSRGEQTGDWTTYDKNGRIVKVTRMR